MLRTFNHRDLCDTRLIFTEPWLCSTWAAIWQHNAAKIGTIYRSPEICNIATQESIDFSEEACCEEFKIK